MDCKPAFATDVRESLYDLIRVDRSGEDALPPAILSFFRQVIIYPAVSYTMYDAFKVRYGKNGIEVIMQYAEACPEIKNNPKFSAFEAYNDLVDAAQRENVDDAFSALDEMPDDVNVRRDIADHIRMCSLNRHSQSETTALIFELCINFLKEGNFRFDAIFGRMKNEESQRLLSLNDARRSEEHIDIESSTKEFSMRMQRPKFLYLISLILTAIRNTSIRYVPILSLFWGYMSTDLLFLLKSLRFLFSGLIHQNA
jgi:hypothetical protein